MGLLEIFKKKEVKLVIDSSEDAYCIALIAMVAIDGEIGDVEMFIAKNRIKTRDWLKVEDFGKHLDLYVEKLKIFGSNEELIIGCVNALDEKHYKDFYFDMFAVALSDKKLEPSESQMMKELKIILNIDDAHSAATIITLYEAFKIK